MQALVGRRPRHARGLRRAAAQRPPGRGADRQPHLGQPPLQGARGAACHRRLSDDTGLAVAAARTGVRRVVSLVPSLTESVAVTAPGLLVGATDWCSHPAGLDVARVRGTKNPDVEAVVALRPDLVLANAEENREVDLAGAARRRARRLGDRRRRPCPRRWSRSTGRCAPAAWTGPAGSTRPTPPGPSRSPARAARPSSRSGGGRGWRSAATPSPATCWPGSASTTCWPRDAERYPPLHPAASPASTWWSCPTSRTRSPPTTARRPSPACRPAASAAGTSPGTARRWPRRARCCRLSCS